MADLEVRDVHKSYGATAVIHGVSVAIRDGEFVVLVGPSGLRQVDAHSNDRRARAHHAGRNPARRQGDQRPPAERARHGDGLPELRALSEHDRLREHGLLAAGCARRAARRFRAGSPAPPKSSGSVRCFSDSRGSSPAASGSGSRWDARSFATRRSFSSTSRCPIWTPSCAWRCARKSRGLHQRLEDDDDLRDPRSGRGDDDGGQDRRHARRHRRAARGTARALRSAAQHVRRGIHRFARDELRQGKPSAPTEERPCSRPRADCASRSGTFPALRRAGR